MTRWIQILYKNQSILDYRKINGFLSALLFLLVVFFLTIPFYIGLYTVDADVYLDQMTGFETSLVQLFDQADCTVDQTLTCTSGTGLIELDGYFAMILDTPSDAVSRENLMVWSKDTISINNDEGVTVIAGGYENFGKLEFSILAQNIRNGSIDPHEFAQNFIRSVNLSMFNEKMVIQYLLLFIQNGFYLLILSWLFLFVSTKRPRPFNYGESLSMMIQLMLGPALFCAVLGIFFPSFASITFTALMVLRIVWLYQQILRKRVRFDEEITEEQTAE